MLRAQTLGHLCAYMLTTGSEGHTGLPKQEIKYKARRIYSVFSSMLNDMSAELACPWCIKDVPAHLAVNLHLTTFGIHHKHRPVLYH